MEENPEDSPFRPCNFGCGGGAGARASRSIHSGEILQFGFRQSPEQLRSDSRQMERTLDFEFMVEDLRDWDQR